MPLLEGTPVLNPGREEISLCLGDGNILLDLPNGRRPEKRRPSISTLAKTLHEGAMTMGPRLREQDNHLLDPFRRGEGENLSLGIHPGDCHHLPLWKAKRGHHPVFGDFSLSHLNHDINFPNSEFKILIPSHLSLCVKA
jgi:hypothetical protein